MRLLLLLLLPLALTAQNAGDGFVDIVYLKDADAVRGNLLSYDHGLRVVLRTENGDKRTFKWEEIKRVSFKKAEAGYTKAPARLVTGTSGSRQDTTALAVPPRRKWRYQLAGNINFGTTRNNDFGSSRSVVAAGIGIGVHLLRSVGPITVGGGVDIGLLNHTRHESMGALTGLVEYGLGRNRRRQLFFRLEAGPAFPFNGDDEETLSDRRLSPLIHPSVGLLVKPTRGYYSELFFDFGYRFMNSRFTLTTVNLDVIERRVNYRRLMLRAGIRL